MSQNVEFSQASPPALEDAVWVMQLLAQAVHKMLDRPDDIYDFEDVGISSIDVPRILGYFAAQRLPAIGSSKPKGKQSGNARVEALSDIWADFLREDRIKRLPEKLLAYFKERGDSTISEAANGKFNFQYVEWANLDAHLFVKALLQKRRLDSLLPTSPAPVQVVHDLDSKMFCAASDYLSGSILWAHQVVPHALVGLVLLDRVFAHEYLSHLVPRNRDLGRAALERWLVALLHEAYGADPSQAIWKNNLWPDYRRALEDHVAGIQTAKNPAAQMVRAFGYAGVEVAAISLYQSAKPDFWRFTDQVLTNTAGEEDARKIDRLLVRFANLGPTPSRELLSRKWNNIQSLYEVAGRP